MTFDQEEVKYFVALSQEPKIGARTFLKLLRRFHKLKNVWRAEMVDFIRNDIPEDIGRLIIALLKKVDPDKEMEKIDQLGIRVITIKDQNYPKLLKEIPDPPSVLYIKGEFKPEDELAIAVIGARKYTSYGIRACEDITKSLAQKGMTIVSGLALGIDSFAHQAALSVKKGRTIGVLACGLDRVYPVSNRKLAEIISTRGAIISEFPLGTPPMKYNFPVRNRIIAGLSLGVLVVEASLRSGSFLTAHSALEYNREIFAVPGSIYSEKSTGPNNLIKMGAKLVSSADDILTELNIESKSEKIEAQKIIPETKEEDILLKLIPKDNPIHIDKLAKLSKLEIAKLNQTLILMEMKGKIRNLGANQYVIVS